MRLSGAASIRARFDKRGRRLADTGHGCGCGLCQSVEAPRYERRLDAAAGERPVWHPLQRRFALLLRALTPS